MWRKHKLQLNQTEEFSLEDYTNAKLYKEHIKLWHDKDMQIRSFELMHQALLFNSKVKLLPRKLKSRWFGPFTVCQVFLHGAVKDREEKSRTQFKVNGERLKQYFRGDVIR